MKNDFSSEQIAEMYHRDYIQFVLAPLIKCKVVVGQFISIRYLFPFDLEGKQNLWGYSMLNPYIRDTINRKEDLGVSILSTGMYFPFYVIPICGTGNYIVFEGRHRIESLRMLMKNGKLDPDYRMLCMIVNPSYICRTGRFAFSFDYQAFSKLVIAPVEYRILSNDKCNPYQRWLYNEADSCNCINEYTHQHTAKTANDLIVAAERYQISLSYWFYDHNIEKSKIVNDEQTFNNWVKEI